MMLASCSSNDDDASTADDSASAATAGDVLDGDSTNDIAECPQMTDDEVETGLDELAISAQGATTICELMEASISPVLVAEPATVAQAQSTADFYVVAYERMAEIAMVKQHSEALAWLTTWIQENLSDSGHALESINSEEELVGLRKP